MSRFLESPLPMLNVPCPFLKFLSQILQKNNGQLPPGMMTPSMQGNHPMGQQGMQHMTQQQQQAMRAANFPGGPNGNQPRGPGGQFASMNPSMQPQQGWPQQRQHPGGIPPNMAYGHSQVGLGRRFINVSRYFLWNLTISVLKLIICVIKSE